MPLFKDADVSKCHVFNCVLEYQDDRTTTKEGRRTVEYDRTTTEETQIEARSLKITLGSVGFVALLLSLALVATVLWRNRRVREKCKKAIKVTLTII